MSSSSRPQKPPRHHHTSPSDALPRFRPSRLALLLSAASLCTSALSLAADPDPAALQAEIARLRQALEQTQKELAAQKAANGNGAPAAPAASAGPATAAPAVAPAVEAADEPQTLDAVVIRTRDRVEKLQDVPLSVSVVSGKELSKLNALDISQLVQRAGNVQWNFGNQRTSSLSIRGIGKQGQTEAQDPAVGLIVDGVSYAYNALSSSFDFTDIDSLEVARGPQGTLLGKNASIGAINVTTNRPSFTPAAGAKVTLGQLNTVKEEAYITGPVVDGLLAWRGSISASKASGPVTNAYWPDLTYTNTDRLSGRVQFLLTPSDKFSARFEADLTPYGGEYTNSRTIFTTYPATYSNTGQPVALSTTTLGRLQRRWFTQSGFNVTRDWLNGVPGAGISGPSVNINAGQPLITGSKGASVELDWNLDGGYTVKSITAYKGYHFDAINDDGTPFDVNPESGGFLNNYRQLSQELRLASPVGGFVDWTTGLYVLDVHNTNQYRRSFGSDAGAFNATAAQYSRLDANAAGRLLMLNSLDGLALNFNSPAGYQDIRNRSDAIFGQANWHFTDRLNLTTGLRFTLEDRQNLAYSNVTANGNGAALNPLSVGNVALGGFGTVATKTNSAGTITTNGGGLLASDTTTQLQLADQVAKQYFGAAITGSPGAAYNSLTVAQKQQVADAQALRAAQIGVLFAPANATPFHKTLPSFVLSPTYKLNEDQTAYFSIQHGEKSGVAQFTNGVSSPVRPERTTAFELGLKSFLLDHSLILDADIYLMNVIDYQQSTSVIDQYTTSLKNDGNLYYTTSTGNVPQVQSKGVEIDSKWLLSKNLTLRFAGAYTDAKYIDFKNSPLPADWQIVSGTPLAAHPFQDLSGRQLPGAAKWTYNLGADYHHPLTLFRTEKDFHANLNVAYSSAFNSDQALSQYAWIGSSYITDLSVGLATLNQSSSQFDVSLLVKNLFNDQTPLSRTWSSFTPTNLPRWFGVVFTGKL
jgi:outer membrane receptor protein involved in Fe transport